MGGTTHGCGLHRLKSEESRPDAYRQIESNHSALQLAVPYFEHGAFLKLMTKKLANHLHVTHCEAQKGGD